MPSTRIEAAELKELAAAGARLELHLGMEQLPRLAKLLEVGQVGVAGQVLESVDVSFAAGAEGFPQVTIVARGNLSLRCQRCLRAVAWPLRLTTQLTVVRADEQAEQLAEPFDSIMMAADGLALDAVIEDEILAALPMSPVHGPGDDCAVADTPIADLKSEQEAGQTYRPFAALATMVGSGGDRKDD